MAFEPPERLVRALAETSDDGDAAWHERLPGLVEEALGACGAAPERVHAPGGAAAWWCWSGSRTMCRRC